MTKRKYDFQVTMESRSLNDDGSTDDTYESKHIFPKIESVLEFIKENSEDFHIGRNPRDVDYYTLDKITIIKVPHERLPFLNDEYLR